MEPGVAELAERWPAVATLSRYLPARASAAAFEGQEHVNTIPSSYRQRDYGTLFYALMRALRPLHVVEVGVFEGFSLLSMAAGIRDNGRGRVAGYDLFDAYPYRRASRTCVESHAAHLGLERWMTVSHDDAFAVHAGGAPADVLHVDISNTGDTYRRIFAQWSGLVRCAILFEGGSADRDRVQWMGQYGKPAIAPAIDELERGHPEWRFTVLEPFPSMTIAWRHG